MLDKHKYRHPCNCVSGVKGKVKESDYNCYRETLKERTFPYFNFKFLQQLKGFVE